MGSWILSNFMAVFLIILLSALVLHAGAQGIGLNYGMKGDNLPPPDKVVALCKSKNVTKLRLFNPDPAALSALRGSGIEVVLGTLNEDLQSLSHNATFADVWVKTNIVPYASDVDFRYISVGNEVIPGDLANYVYLAMRNVDAALKAAGLSGVPVTTSVSTKVLGVSFPPSAGEFSSAALPAMSAISSFLASSGTTPLLVNVYPYFAYAGSPPGEVRLDYALFATGGAVVVRDGALNYTNLFDAMVDSVYAALGRAGSAQGLLEVVVSETGWPSGGGGVGATVGNAETYNNNAVAHVRSGAGTPRRPAKEIEAYLFALFNEDLKPPGTEQYFGFFNPDMSPVYPINL